MVDNNETRPKHVGEPGFNSKDINWRLIGFIVMVVLGVIFFLQNDQEAELNFLFFDTERKTRWLVIVCIGIGVLADRLFTLWWNRRKKRKLEEKLASS